ncbi:hypothetical protein AWM75_07840 [Aerococcus urinaehominis]|uniref:Uncharacterized protein n=1 Tax=Aerococcus urinaehominis TaxID=128944 RepID=A0A0X8FM69_9LACT|nr:sigma factor [Aerococcus urinaehominis]AMB99883.1 hypothetical protein AWM75_07840 [Aerococcus urinaehominis]SDM53157.1 Sigma-70 region 2 [Aerococcus urinaehominis]
MRQPCFSEQVIREFTPLIYTAIYRFGLSRHHRHFDDYYQELSLKLLSLTNTFDGDVLGADRYQFTAYATTSLRRYMIDLWRKYQQDDHQALGDYDPLDGYWLESELHALSSITCP